MNIHLLNESVRATEVAIAHHLFKDLNAISVNEDGRTEKEFLIFPEDTLIENIYDWFIDYFKVTIEEGEIK